MNCNDARMLLFLNREGERTPSENDSLHEHIATCPQCRDELRDAEHVRTIVARLRNDVPAVSNSGDLTSSIMKAIEPVGLPVGRPQERSVASRRHSRVRFGAAVIVTAFIAAFVVQSTLDAWKIALLEQRLGRTMPHRTEASMADLQQVLRLVPEDLRSRIEERMREQGASLDNLGSDVRRLLMTAGPMVFPSHPPLVTPGNALPRTLPGVDSLISKEIIRHDQ